MRSGFFKPSAPIKAVAVRSQGKENAKTEATQPHHVVRETSTTPEIHITPDVCQQLSEPSETTAAPAPLPPAVAAAQPLVVEVDPITWQKNFDQCLILLKGPEDEKRFVGLLLVTKLLPHGGQESVQSVHDALGMTFVARLLLPITRAAQAHASGNPSQHQTPPTQQQQLSVSLGLTILSALCRLPDVCSSPELLQLLPACVLVAVAGGVSSALTPSQPTSQTTQQQASVETDPAVTQKAEAEAVADALECLVAVASSSSSSSSSSVCKPSLHDVEESVSVGARAVLEAGGLQAAVAVATVAVAATLAAASAPEASSTSGAASESEGAVSQRVTLLALQLAGILLQPVGSEGFDVELRSEVIAERYCPLQPLIQVLGVLVGHGPRQSPSVPPVAAVASAAEGAQPEKVKIVSSPVNGLDAAVLQLEALHTLLLLLPLSEYCPSYSSICMEATFCSGSGSSSSSSCSTTDAALGLWPDAVRRGINQMLRSRLPGPQRHSVLRLAAGMVDLAGAGWLLPRAGVEKGAGVSSSPGALLAVMVETLSVETELLLYDALHPDAPLLQPTSLRTATRPNHTPLQPSAALITALEERAEALPMEVMAAEAEAVDAASSAAAAGASANVTLASITSSTSHGASSEASAVSAVGTAGLQDSVTATAVADMDLDLTGGMEFESRMVPDISNAATDSARSGSMATSAAAAASLSDPKAASSRETYDIPSSLETSGLRAATMLPACYSLIEASIEALAQDSALIVEEDLADLHMDSESEAGEDDERPGFGQSVRKAQGPVLGAEEARKLMPALGRSVESMLQFVETVAQQVRSQHRRQQRQHHAQEQGKNSASPGAAQRSQSEVPVVAEAADEDEDEVAMEGADPSIWPNCSSSSAGPDSSSPSSTQPLLTELQSNLCLGATRVIGRFLAEVPQEASSGIFLRLLPTLLSLPVEYGSFRPVQADVAFAPLHTQPPITPSDAPTTVLASAVNTYSENQSSQQQQQQQQGLPSWAIRFLIPGLLQATEGSSAESKAVADRIRGSKSALTCLAGFLEARAGQATATLHSLPQTQFQGATFPEETQRQIATQEQAVADAAVLLLATLLRPGGSSTSRPTGFTGTSAASSGALPQPTQLSDGEVLELMQQPMREVARWLAIRCGMSSELQRHSQQVMKSITDPASCACCLVSMAQHTLLPRPLLATACLMSAVLAKLLASTGDAAAAEVLVSSYLIMNQESSSETSGSSSSSGQDTSQVVSLISLSECFSSLVWAMQSGCVLWSAELAESNDPDAWDVTLATQLRKQTQQRRSQQHASKQAASESPDKQETALPAGVLMNEFPGDAEDCWRRLMAIQGAALLPRLPSMRAAAASLPWVQQICGSAVTDMAGGASGSKRSNGKRTAVTETDRELLSEAGVAEWLEACDLAAV